MGQVRWAGWTVVVATVLVVSGVGSATGQTKSSVDNPASDKPAAIVVYPDIWVDPDLGGDTIIRLANVHENNQAIAHCFYVDANSHCSGGPNNGAICTDDPGVCTGLSFCVPGWLEVDFRIHLTKLQPIEWKASEGLADTPRCDGGAYNGQLCRLNEPSDCPGGTCKGLPLPTSVCQLNQFRSCGKDDDCSRVNGGPGGPCTQSNRGTRIPPVPETPFVGELRCIVVDANGNPQPDNVLKGEAISVSSQPSDLDVSGYNAIGFQAVGGAIDPKELVLGPGGAYNGCPNYLILNHFFDEAYNPVPGSDAVIYTELTLVPCSVDYLRQIPGAAVVQYLVFNEFEQRFSTSKTVRCFDETVLCNIDTPQCSRSIFNVSVAGTLTGQTRMQPIGNGLIGVAREFYLGDVYERTAAFNLHMQGQHSPVDRIILP
jgi:hypothetical protein